MLACLAQAASSYPFRTPGTVKLLRSPGKAGGFPNVLMGARITLPKDKLAEFCHRNHIRRLSLFGSALRGDYGPDSDIDLLAEFEPGHAPGFIKLAGMERELSTMLDNRPVDLRTPEELSRYFRNQVIAEAEEQYAEH